MLWCFQRVHIKPWPNGTPNSSQFEPSSQLRWSCVSFGHPLGLSWLELDRVGFNLIKLKFSPNLSQVFHCLATLANSSQLSPSCFVIVRWLRGCSQTIDMAFLRAGQTWRYRLATHWRKFWFCNLAWVGLKLTNFSLPYWFGTSAWYSPNKLYCSSQQFEVQYSV